MATISGGNGPQVIPGTSEPDLLSGDWGNDTLLGLGGGDTLLGGPGQPDPFQTDTADDDVILGGAAADSLFGGWADDLLDGGAGADSLSGGWGDDTMHGGAGDDLLAGGTIGTAVFDDDDLMFGGAGNDTLRGFFGNDTMIGGSGDDEITPHAGDDVMLGGPGRDSFLFGISAPRMPFIGIDRNDVILDFKPGQDVLDLSALNYLGGTDDLDFVFIGDAPFSGSGTPEVRAVVADGWTVVELDVQFGTFQAPDGQADGVIRLAGELRLSEADFVL
jgi:Ca2+-binding RTX toxin-like protein